MKIAIAENKSYETTTAWESLDKAITSYTEEGFEITDHLNVSLADENGRGVRMHKHNDDPLYTLLDPKYTDEVIIVREVNLH